MERLTSEEINLICIYSADTREEVIESLEVMRKYLEFDEVELKALTDATIAKLKNMTTDEFKTLDLYPEF